MLIEVANAPDCHCRQTAGCAHVLLLLPLLLCMTFSLSNLHYPMTLSSTKSDA